MNEKYITYEYLSVAKNENLVMFLGYRLTLTKTEYLILKALTSNGGSALSAEQISNQIGLELTKENIAFHIFNINKKAKCISERILIKNNTKIVYFLH